MGIWQGLYEKCIKSQQCKMWDVNLGFYCVPQPHHCTPFLSSNIDTSQNQKNQLMLDLVQHSFSSGTQTYLFIYFVICGVVSVLNRSNALFVCTCVASHAIAHFYEKCSSVE